jgi:large subunit ribosomal protein L29
MNLLKIEEMKDFDLEKIQIEIIELKKQLFNLRVRKKTRRNVKPHLFKYIQYRLKQLIFLEYRKILEKTDLINKKI